MKKFWENYKFSFTLLLGIFVGALIGVVMGEKATALEPIGQIFLNLMFTIVVPMVFVSIASSVGSMLNMKRLGKILGSMVGTFIVTGLFAAAIVLVVVNVLSPAANTNIAMEATEMGEMQSVSDMIVGSLTVDDFTGLLSRKNMLPIIIAAILTGLAVAKCGGMRLFIDGFSVLCDFYDVGVCVADCNAGSIRICFHFRFNEDTACDFRHFHFDNTGGRHVPRGLCLLCGNTVQTFQPFIRVSPAGPQCRGVAVTNLGAVGDSAGKRVLEHTAVQPQSDMFYRTGSMLSGCGNNKGNRARLGHTQSRAHILPDKFCQFMHSLAPLECSLLKMPRRGLRRSGDIF